MGHLLTPSEIRLQLLPLLIQHNVKQAVLIGSYTKGTADDKSDIDLLVDSSLRGLRFVSLCEEVRQALGKEVDLLDVTHIEKKFRD